MRQLVTPPSALHAHSAALPAPPYLAQQHELVQLLVQAEGGLVQGGDDAAPTACQRRVREGGRHIHMQTHGCCTLALCIHHHSKTTPRPDPVLVHHGCTTLPSPARWRSVLSTCMDVEASRPLVGSSCRRTQPGKAAGGRHCGALASGSRWGNSSALPCPCAPPPLQRRHGTSSRHGAPQQAGRQSVPHQQQHRRVDQQLHADGAALALAAGDALAHEPACGEGAQAPGSQGRRQGTAAARRTLAHVARPTRGSIGARQLQPQPKDQGPTACRLARPCRHSASSQPAHR